MAKQKVASTQEHLDIDDIIDDLVILKTGWVALVMSTTAVNFDLLSEAEQDATIYAYGAFLNSLSFPLEVLVRSKKADITSYFQNLEEAENSQPNPDLKRQIQKYKDFIQSTVQQKTVLDKKFYLIITYSSVETGIKMVGSKKSTPAKSKAELLADAKTALVPKRDHVIKQTARLGLTTKQLTTQELIELFYDIYNPAPTGTQRVLLDTESYTTPIVEPALEVPGPAPVAPEQSQQPIPPQNPQPAPAQNNPGFNIPQPEITHHNPAPLYPQELSASSSMAASPFGQNPQQQQAQSQQPPAFHDPIGIPPSAPVSGGLDLRANLNTIPQQPENPQPPTPADPNSQLRPVMPMTPPSPQGAIPNTQAEALRNLQEAASRAAQISNAQPVNMTYTNSTDQKKI